MRSIRVLRPIGITLAGFAVGLLFVGQDDERVAYSEPAISITPSTSPSAVRYWVDVTGKHSVHATLVEIHGEIVYLQKADGKISAVPIRRLCNADQDYVNALHTDYVLVGKIVGLTDGDTITMLGASNQQLKIRLEGIDAPESGQDYGTKAKQSLGEKVFGKTATVEWRTTDKYGRFLGHVLVDGTWINKQIVDEGLAWHYKEFNDSAVLADAEATARAARLGLWQDKEPVAPWVFRHPAAQPRAPPVEVAQSRNFPATSSFTHTIAPINRRPSVDRSPAAVEDEIVYLTNSGTKYHRAGCRYLSKSSIPTPLSEAAAGHSPCSVCHPPLVGNPQPGSSRSVTTYTPPKSTPRSTYTPPTTPGYVDRNPYSERVTGQTATGIPTFTGPRGGRYHYSKSGKKVYEKKK